MNRRTARMRARRGTLPHAGNVTFPIARLGHFPPDLPSGQLGGISEVSKDGQGSLAVITLDFDSVLADRTAGGACRFQLSQNGTQVRCNGIKAGDEGYSLAFAAFLATNTNGLIHGEPDFAISPTGAGTLIQRLLTSLAGDWAFQRRSIKQP